MINIKVIIYLVIHTQISNFLDVETIKGLQCKGDWYYFILQENTGIEFMIIY